MRWRQTRHDEAARAKLALILNLRGRKLDPDKLRRWYRWLDWLLELPPEIDKELWRQVDLHDEEKKVPYVTFADRYAMEQGRRPGLLDGLRLALKLEFGDAGSALAAELERQDKLETLQAVYAGVESAGSSDELRRLLP